MKEEKVDVLIIGAGLSGLALGYYLSGTNKKVKCIEARSRVGGRIWTETSLSGPPIEMGATWLGAQHKHLLALLTELNLEVFDQALGGRAIVEPISTSPPYLATLPSNNEPSMRIRGGSHQLINALVDAIGTASIQLDEKVLSITVVPNGLLVRSDKSTYDCQFVISTLPPNLALNSMTFDPPLPDELTSIAKATHTWMGESIKVALSFKTAFWQNDRSSGTIMSNVGPVPEMYEHNDFENAHFALMGFMNGHFYSLSREERCSMLIQQLERYYGSVAQDYIAYHEKVWRSEALTYWAHDDHIVPHQNNGHAQYRELYLSDRFLFSGSETSPLFPGYMEGAVYSALLAAGMLRDRDF